MADLFDQASDLEQLTIDIALQNHQAAPRLKPKGLCYYCSDPVPPTVLFCDADCCQWYDAEQAAKKRNGR